MFEELLDDVSKPIRVAIAGACVEHVIDVYRKANFGYRAAGAAALLGTEPSADLVDAALALAWRFAERGKAVDPRAIAAFNAQASTPPAATTHDAAAGPARRVLEAVEQVLLATQDEMSDAAAEALGKCEDVLSDMIESLDEYEERAPDEACEQENAWQAEVIAHAQRAEGALSRAHFADLIARKLPWQRFIAR